MTKLLFTILLFGSIQTFAALPPGVCDRLELITVLQDSQVANSLAMTGAIQSVQSVDNNYTFITAADGYGHPGCAIQVTKNYAPDSGECPAFDTKVQSSICK